jgi:hypothetical protein
MVQHVMSPVTVRLGLTLPVYTRRVPVVAPSTTTKVYVRKVS